MSRFLWTQKRRHRTLYTFRSCDDLTILFALIPFCSEAVCLSGTRSGPSTRRGNGRMGFDRELRISVRSLGEITFSVPIAFARRRSCLAACPNRAPHLATPGAGTGKTGRKLTRAGIASPFGPRYGL